MKVKLIIIAAVLLCASTALAKQVYPEAVTIGGALLRSQGDYVQRVASLSDHDRVILAAGDKFNDFPGFDKTSGGADHKSISRAFLYSAAVPGLGELYAGSKIKAGLFFAIDAFCWSQYLTKHSSGIDKEDEFQAYANQHWSATRFVVSAYEGRIDPEYKENHNPWTVEKYINDGDKLPSVKDQQYFEMIGKYDKFMFGWDDSDPITGASSNRQRYVVMRDDSNDKLTAARRWAMISLANHVLSALDAAISAKRFNKQREEFSEITVKAKLARYDDQRIPQIVFTYKFY
jgi:hypothetical protein